MSKRELPLRALRKVQTYVVMKLLTATHVRNDTTFLCPWDVGSGNWGGKDGHKGSLELEDGAGAGPALLALPSE